MTTRASATLGVAYLVFVMDRSNSMGNDQKLASCSAALSAFFADPKTAGLSAQLTWLPEVTPGTTSTGASPTFLCSASSYGTPDVPLTALPSGAFASAIGDASLEFGTPTVPALEGAGIQARALVTANPGAHVAIILATDGLPSGCTGDTVSAAADAAAALAKKGIATYVIGVGAATANLDAIAAGGGTTSAFIVPTGDAGGTESAFLAAIQSVAATLLPCAFAIPAAPNGQTLDPSKVNVLYTPGGAGSSPSTLGYSPGCSDPSGWQYDDALAPTKIELCSQACTMAQGDSRASLEVAFGCATVAPR